MLGGMLGRKLLTKITPYKIYSSACFSLLNLINFMCMYYIYILDVLTRKSFCASGLGGLGYA